MSDKDEDYQKERDAAAAITIDDSMTRKMGRAFPQGYKDPNPVRTGHTDNKYRPLRW